MVGWTIGMLGIMLIGVVVVFKWKQRQAGHIAYWQQQRAVEQRKGEAASQLPDSQERCQKMDHAKASVERIDGELSRLAESWEDYFESVGHHASKARGSTPR
jgi:6-phosphogluconate dehydrogenase (decarboxylating)